MENNKGVNFNMGGLKKKFPVKKCLDCGMEYVMSTQEQVEKANYCESIRRDKDPSGNTRCRGRLIRK